MKSISEGLATANIDELTIWSDNPRVGYRFPTEKEAINVLFQVAGFKKMFNLAEDILARGLAVHVLPLIVIEDGKLNVYDGNRRISCMKCIDNPSLLDDINTQNKFQNLKEEYRLTKDITISIVETSKEAIELITLTHSGEQDGVGLLEWESLERDKMLDKNNKAVLYPYAYEVCKIMNINRKTDFRGNPHYTDIDRVFKSEPIKKYIGISSYNEIPNKSELVKDIFNKLKEYKEYKKANSYSRLFNEGEEYTNFIKFMSIKKPSVDPINKPPVKTNISTAFIKLKSNRSINIPSEQIDLYKEIIDARDSGGNKISNNDIILESQDIKIVNGILHSINEIKTIKVIYKYVDVITGVVFSDLELNFIENSRPLNGNTKKEYLITNIARESYLININSTISKLVEQINSLNIDKYIEVIACSIRTLFEVSNKIINKTKKYNNKFMQSELNEQVKSIISYLMSNSNNLTAICNNTGISYKDLMKYLNAEDFEKAIGHAHLGAHTSTYYLSINDVKQLGKLVSVYLVLANEMINNNNVK